MLVGNRSVLLKSPGRWLAGTVSSIDRSGFGLPGMMRSAAFDAKAAWPYGHLAPSAWLLPRTAGGMSSANFASVSLGAAGSILGGVNGEASATITFTVADADGQLIVSGAGSASLTFTVADALLTASIGGTGSASMAITGTALLGAEASLEGGASFAFTAAADILPLDDTPPARTASASFSFSGTLTPYAIGIMSGSTVDSTVLTADIIAAAMLAAAAASPIAADIKRVNSYEVTGDGQTGTEWGPA